MKQIHKILLWLLLLSASVHVVAQPFSGNLASGSNSHCRPVSDSLTFYISYPAGGVALNRYFGNNEAELTRMGHFLRKAFADTTMTVQSVGITGYTSIEGTYADNRELASARTNGMKRYLDKHYNLSAHSYADLNYVAEDWVTLRQMIAVSAAWWRSEALSVIDRTGIFDGREKILMELQGGTPYREMAEGMFPKLRRVEITVKYEAERIYCAERTSRSEQTSVARESDPLCKDTVYVYRSLPQAVQRQQPIRVLPERKRLKPVMGIKTNLVGWAGITPDWERTTLMPNLAAEVFFAGQWSAEVSAVYSNFDFGSKEHWGVTGYSLEPRFWLNSKGEYTGFYFGLYGQAGDFNVQRTAGNNTGTYLQGGISLGYYLRLWAHWGIEFGVRGGYRKAKVTPYDIEDGAYYLSDRQADGSRVGLTRINVSASYRF